MAPRSIALFAAALALCCPAPAQRREPRLVRRSLKFGAKNFPYSVFAPNGRGGLRAAPAILLLHGAGGRGADMLAAWAQLARDNEILLIAPDLPRDPDFEEIAPRFFRALVDAVASEWSVDARRVYVFGHSMGGYLAFDAAMLDADYFAAAAIHASFIAPDFVSIADRATRKIPIALYIGSADPLVPLASVRATRRLLLAHDFPLHYVELPAHGHDYFAASVRIDADAWNFFRSRKLR